MKKFVKVLISIIVIVGVAYLAYRFGLIIANKLFFN